jgi:hypothetical protein
MAKLRVRDDMRKALAVLAARLMAEDGINDYGLAKRKAAKQLGVMSARMMPNNDEIDWARREHQAIFQIVKPPVHLHQLRALAVRVMRGLSDFDPHLTGGVLSGLAGQYATVTLQLFVDSPKLVENFLLDRQLNYRTSQLRCFIGQQAATVPLYMIEETIADVELAVFAVTDLRHPLRMTPQGRIMERARLAQVESLLVNTDDGVDLPSA